MIKKLKALTMWQQLQNTRQDKIFFKTSKTADDECDECVSLGGEGGREQSQLIKMIRNALSWWSVSDVTYSYHLQVFEVL